jgi:hypothetical protein
MYCVTITVFSPYKENPYSITIHVLSNMGISKKLFKDIISFCSRQFIQVHVVFHVHLHPDPFLLIPNKTVQLVKCYLYALTSVVRLASKFVDGFKTQEMLYWFSFKTKNRTFPLVYTNCIVFFLLSLVFNSSLKHLHVDLCG